MPTPNKNEKQKDYISRCMGDTEMNSKHPDQKERAAVCYSMWKQHQKKQAKAWIKETLGDKDDSN